MSPSLTVLIIGGYGTFGGRLVELLEDEVALNIIISGRSFVKAEAYCRARKGACATLTPALFDRSGNLEEQLAQWQPDIVVDASGPFQNYGAAPYRVIEACISLKINYLDLADGSTFVDGVAQYDPQAKQAGVFILSGVSSFPVLTVAVVRHLAQDMQKVQSIIGGIAPSPYAGVGDNVIRAIAGYAGQPVTLLHGGKEKTLYPLTETRRYTVAAPGFVPLRNKLFSLVDVPDLKVLAKLWPETEYIWMGAAPVPEIMHRALILFAGLVKHRLVASLLPLAPLMALVMRYVRWGEHRGGMFVEVAGEDQSGHAVKKSWHLLAEGTDGPLIPSMAAEFIIRQILAGKRIKAGARTAVEDISLEDYQALFARRSIETGMRDDTPPSDNTVYQTVLGNEWNNLPPEIRAMHNLRDRLSATGKGTVKRGWNPLAHLICGILGMPKSSEDISVKVTFTAQDRIETWTRQFGTYVFKSLQYAGKGRDDRLLVERFGVLRFGMALVPEDGKLKLVLRHWSAFGIPLPMWLCVKSDSFETVIGGRFHFHVKLSHPLIGPIIHYQGWLEMEAA
jgi:hypothetical protein